MGGQDGPIMLSDAASVCDLWEGTLTNADCKIIEWQEQPSTKPRVSTNQIDVCLELTHMSLDHVLVDTKLSIADLHQPPCATTALLSFSLSFFSLLWDGK